MSSGTSNYTSIQGKELPMYYMTRDGFSYLCMGFTGKIAARWKEQFINAFNQLESLASQPLEERYDQTRKA